MYVQQVSLNQGSDFYINITDEILVFRQSWIHDVVHEEQ